MWSLLQEQLKIFYDTVAELTLMNDVLRLSGLPPPLIGVAVGDLRNSLNAFEHLRCFSDYRTPSGIRAYTRLFQILIPVLLTPYFAYLGTEGGTVGMPWVVPETPFRRWGESCVCHVRTSAVP